MSVIGVRIRRLLYSFITEKPFKYCKITPTFGVKCILKISWVLETITYKMFMNSIDPCLLI